MVDGTNMTPPQGALSCIMPTRTPSFTVEMRDESPHTGLRRVPSDDSDVFSGLESTKNVNAARSRGGQTPSTLRKSGSSSKSKNGSRTGSSAAEHGSDDFFSPDVFKGVRFEDPIATNSGSYNRSSSSSNRSQQLSALKPALSQNQDRDHYRLNSASSISTSKSAENASSARRGFFRSLPAVTDRDSYLTSSSSDSASGQSQGLGSSNSNEERGDDVYDNAFEDGYGDGYDYGHGYGPNSRSFGGSADMNSDASSLAFITEVQVSSASSEDRIAAMFAEHETRMNHDLEIIQEIAEIDSSPTEDSNDSGMHDFRSYPSSPYLPKKSRSEDDHRRTISQSNMRKMQRVMQQSRREVEILKENNEQFLAEMEQTDEEHKSDMKLFEDRTKQKITELRSMYLDELDLLTKEKDAAILEASRQSALYAESGRKKVASLQRQLKKAKEANASIVYEAMSTVASSSSNGSSSKRQRSRDLQAETAKIRHEYESKFKRFKADSALQIKAAIEKAVNHNTKRIVQEKNRELADSIALIKQRVERDSILERKAFQERHEKVSGALDEARRKIDIFQGEHVVIAQILGMVKGNLELHNGEKIQKFYQRQQSQMDDDRSINSVLKYEQSVSKYHDIVGKSFVTEMGSAMQDILTLYAYLLQSAEDSPNGKSRNEVSDNSRVADDLRRQLGDSAKRIAQLESDLEQINRDQMGFEKLKAQQKAMAEKEKGHKSMEKGHKSQVATAIAQLECSNITKAERDEAVGKSSDKAEESLTAPRKTTYGKGSSNQQENPKPNSENQSSPSTSLNDPAPKVSAGALNNSSCPESDNKPPLSRSTSEASLDETSASSSSSLKRRKSADRFKWRSRHKNKNRAETDTEHRDTMTSSEGPNVTKAPPKPPKPPTAHSARQILPPGSNVEHEVQETDLVQSSSTSSTLSSASEKRSSLRNAVKNLRKSKILSVAGSEIASQDEDERLELPSNPASPESTVQNMRVLFESLGNNGEPLERPPNRNSMTDSSTSSLIMAESGVSSPKAPPVLMKVLHSQESTTDNKESEVVKRKTKSTSEPQTSAARRTVLGESSASNKSASANPDEEEKTKIQTKLSTANDQEPPLHHKNMVPDRLRSLTKRKIFLSSPRSDSGPSTQIKRKSSLNMFANKRKASPRQAMSMSSVSEECKDVKGTPKAGQLLPPTASPSPRATPNFRVRNSWRFGKKEPPNNELDDSEPSSSEQNTVLKPKVQENANSSRSPQSHPSSVSRATHVNADDGLHEVPPLTSRHVLKKRKPVIVDGRPQTPSDSSLDERAETTPPESPVSEQNSPNRTVTALSPQEFDASVTFSARRRQRFVTPATTGHTMFANPLSVSRPQTGSSANQHQSMQNVPSWTSHESENLEMASTSVSEDCGESNDFDACESASQMREQAGYPSLGDKSDDEYEEDDNDTEVVDSDADSVDKYATFSPVEFAEKKAMFEQTGSLRGKRITASGVARLPSIPDLDNGPSQPNGRLFEPNQKTKETQATPQKQRRNQQQRLSSTHLQSLPTPTTPQRNSIFCRAGLSAFSPPPLTPPSPSDSHGSSEATTTITAHTHRSSSLLRSFGSGSGSGRTSLLPPRGSSKNSLKESTKNAVQMVKSSSKRSLGFGKLKRHSSASGRS